LDIEKNKKKEEFRKVQYMYRPQYPHAITLEQLPLGATNPDTPETLQDRRNLDLTFDLTMPSSTPRHKKVTLVRY